MEAERHRESVGALSMASNLTERWRQASSGRLTERERIEARQAVFQALIRGLGQFLRIGMIAVGVWLVITNGLTVGGIFAARVMAGFGYTLVERAMRNWRSLRDALAAYGNLKQQLRQDNPSQPSLLPGTKEAPLVLDSVSFRYPGQRQDVFRRLSFALEPGELLMITGGAGTGKSTLSRLLVGLAYPRAGWVRLGDIELTRLPVEVRADLIGYLPQHTELLDGTIRENIARMGSSSIDKVVEAAKLVGIHDVIVGLPDGYDTPINSASIGLSGSERKRIALARAILNRPRLIVLDEPSANLDSPSRRVMEAALKQLKLEGASIVATQAIESTQLARIADKFLTLGGATPELTRADGRESRKLREVPNLRSVK
jgi:ATP-binding cassette subfamily C protein